MSEFRQDIINKNWVLIAQSRAARPDAFINYPATPPGLTEVARECQFCPGNEAQVSPEIAQYPRPTKLPGKEKWLVRVVPNKFEAVDHYLGRTQEEFYVSRPGIGDHEVVITRVHNQPLALQDPRLIDLMLQVYIDRINELKFHHEVRYVHIIQNHGATAGASIVHPHSQIFAIPFLPDRVQDELAGTRSYYDLDHACVYCEIILYELKIGQRVIMDNPDFLVVAPYASKMPFEMHILPKRHRSSFNDITIPERKSLAAIMKQLFWRLYDRMKNPAYNFYIHSVPFGGSIESKTHDDRQSYHWHIVVLPRVNVWAGFELGTEVYVNAVAPEKVRQYFY